MWLGDGFLSSFSKDNNANFLVKKKCNEAFRGVYTRTNFKSNLILVAVLVLESKGLYHWQIDEGRFLSSLTFLKLLVISA